MAIYGDGFCLDKTFKIGNELKTTTSQYKVVGFVPGTTASADLTVNLCGVANSIGAATATAYHAIGIIQSFQSSSSDHASVRLFGIAKATCAESISAGQFIMPYWGVSTTTRPGQIVSVDDGVTCTVYGQTTVSHCVILGRALENGSTGTVISIFLNPQLYDNGLVGTIGIT